MGNKICCFSYKTPTPVRKSHLDGAPAGDNVTDWKRNSHANLPHISEREPEDFEENPSIHAKAGTLFMERSKVSENGMVRKKSLSHIADAGRLKKSNSCSTIYVDDNTVSQPNLKNTIKCVALAIYYNIKNRTSDRQLDIFDEKLHPLTRENWNVLPRYSKRFANFPSCWHPQWREMVSLSSQQNTDHFKVTDILKYYTLMSILVTLK